MKPWFKHAFLSAAGYVVVIAAIAVIFHWINSVGGVHDNSDNNLFYVWVAMAGLVVAFLAGFCFCPLLERMISRYSTEHSDLTQEDIRSLCREKLLTRYFCILACGSFLAAIAVAIAVGIDTYPEMICILSGAGFTFAFLYFQTRNHYKQLYREKKRLYRTLL